MDKKIILERLQSLNGDTERLSNFIGTEVKEAYIESYTNGSFSGWKYSIVYDTEDDTLSIIGPRSNNSMTMAEYQDIAYCLGSIPAEASLDNATIVPDGYIESMDQESQKELLEFYEDEYSRENSTIEDMLNDFRADRDYILHQCYPNAYEELLKEYIEQMWDVYEADHILEKVNNSLEQHIDYLEYEMQTEE